MIRIMKADLFQRIRIPSFFVTVAMLLFLSVISTPRAKGVIQVLSIDPTVYRQADNPSWLPSSAALILGLILPIIGFLFIRNSLSLDRETGVADLFMTTRFHRFRYVFGKFTANCLLLVSLWLTVVIGTFFYVDFALSRTMALYVPVFKPFFSTVAWYFITFGTSSISGYFTIFTRNIRNDRDDFFYFDPLRT